MGFILDMVTGDVFSEDATVTSVKHESNNDKLIDHPALEYNESLSYVSNCPASKVEDNLIPEQLIHVDIEKFLDEVEGVSQ